MKCANCHKKFIPAELKIVVLSIVIISIAIFLIFRFKHSSWIFLLVPICVAFIVSGIEPLLRLFMVPLFCSDDCYKKYWRNKK